MNKIELKRLINECVQKCLYENENTSSQQKDFARQICEFIKEKANMLHCDKTELAKLTIRNIQEYYDVK